MPLESVLVSDIAGDGGSQGAAHLMPSESVVVSVASESVVVSVSIEVLVVVVSVVTVLSMSVEVSVHDGGSAGSAHLVLSKLSGVLECSRLSFSISAIADLKKPLRSCPGEEWDGGWSVSSGFLAKCVS